MLPLHRYLLCLLLTICLLAFGCSTAKELGKTLGDLEKIRAELVKKFGEQGVNLRLNTFRDRTILSVIYPNSPLNEKTSEDRVKRAQETAETVKQLYPSIKNVNEIWVGFMRVKTRMVIFHYSEMIETVGFDNEAHVLREPGKEPEVTSEPLVNYRANQNKTEVTGGAIQLEGTAEKGVMFFPHFSVAGDINKITPKRPNEIGFDFASFSEKPKFPNLTKIVFLSDNKVVYSTEGQFSTSKIAGEMYSEFLYLKVPTPAFVKITSGSTIKLRLNKDEYALTDSEILNLQRMADYLR